MKRSLIIAGIMLLSISAIFSIVHIYDRLTMVIPHESELKKFDKTLHSDNASISCSIDSLNNERFCRTSFIGTPFEFYDGVKQIKISPIFSIEQSSATKNKKVRMFCNDSGYSEEASGTFKFNMSDSSVYDTTKLDLGTFLNIFGSSRDVESMLRELYVSNTMTININCQNKILYTGDTNAFKSFLAISYDFTQKNIRSSFDDTSYTSDDNKNYSKSDDPTPIPLSSQPQKQTSNLKPLSVKEIEDKKVESIKNSSSKIPTEFCSDEYDMTIDKNNKALVKFDKIEDDSFIVFSKSGTYVDHVKIVNSRASFELPETPIDVSIYHNGDICDLKVPRKIDPKFRKKNLIIDACYSEIPYDSRGIMNAIYIQYSIRPLELFYPGIHLTLNREASVFWKYGVMAFKTDNNVCMRYSKGFINNTLVIDHVAIDQVKTSP